MSKKYEKPKEYAINMHKKDLEYDKYYLEEAFENGWEEALKEILVDVRKELPEYDEDVLVINEYCDKFFSHRSNDPNVVVDKDGWCNYSGSDIIAWIRNVTFEEILMMNKDVLKRLNDK